MHRLVTWAALSQVSTHRLLKFLFRNDAVIVLVGIGVALLCGFHHFVLRDLSIFILVNLIKRESTPTRARTLIVRSCSARARTTARGSVAGSRAIKFA
jgi:hypothetical protein